MPLYRSSSAWTCLSRVRIRELANGMCETIRRTMNPLDVGFHVNQGLGRPFGVQKRVDTDDDAQAMDGSVSKANSDHLRVRLGT
jgi:hypothetical protein